MPHKRPRTEYVTKKRSRRCPKCNAALNHQLKRCKRCAKVVAFPKKGKKASK